MKTSTLAAAILAATVSACAGSQAGSGNDPGSFSSAMWRCEILADRHGSGVMRDCLRRRGWDVPRRRWEPASARERAAVMVWIEDQPERSGGGR